MITDVAAILKTEKVRQQSSNSEVRNKFDNIYDDIKHTLVPFMIEKVDEGILAIPLFLNESSGRNGVMERRLVGLIDYMIQEDLFSQLQKRCSEQKLEISYTHHGDFLILVVNFLKHVPI